MVGAARLDDGLPLFGLALERLCEVVEGGDEIGDECLGHCDVHRCREDIVRRLRRVNVVVRVNLAAELLGRERRQNLVHVHVRAGARAGLVGVDRELGIVLARDDLVGGPGDRIGDLAVERAQILVREGRGLLDAGECGDVAGLETLAGDGEVLHGALRLRAVQRVDGDAHLAHGVVFDAVFGHFITP
jgi:hypothetical protein